MNYLIFNNQELVFSDRKLLIPDKQILIYEERKDVIINRNWIMLRGRM
jgi:hypothetical protein